MYILGIHDGHNSSVCLMRDGKLVSALQEERLQRIKNYWGAPNLAIKKCLSEEGISFEDIEHVVFSLRTLILYSKRLLDKKNHL